jgi:hypothetical protein
VRSIIIATDLSPEEQKHVRTAIRFLHLRCQGWDTLAKAIRIEPDSIYRIVSGRRSVTASTAVSVARLLGSSIDDLLGGRFLPAGTCEHCGHVADGVK